MSEQEMYRSILQRMIEQTEREQINNTKDFIQTLSHEIKQKHTFSIKNWETK
ncbi:hypothetical protein [Gracilibacillus halophilus]|uniref:hypothetical protein n=1 Tax=Gracilibacillus halophilus TaxID=470864 RepID=UPI0003A7EB13|nr:hypothetical protein [Gracilibacillus halophilus]